jgi:hypothetical protein|tara:strand:- start:6580 stop:7026 length:447 start_codon:yes stop_codon:yes gene_type:complete
MTTFFLQMRSYNKFVFALTSIFILSRFVFSDSTNLGITKDKPKLSYKQVIVKKNDTSLLTQSIQKIPTVARAISAASAANDPVAITRSQKELTIQGTGSSRLDVKTSECSEGILVVGATVQKFLNDSEQTDRSIYLGELVVEIASLES